MNQDTYDSVDISPSLSPLSPFILLPISNLSSSVDFGLDNFDLQQFDYTNDRKPDLCATKDVAHKTDSSLITDVSHEVKEQLIHSPYAIINAAQNMKAVKDSDHLICGFVSSIYCNTNRVISHDIIGLLHSFYPLFYWNDEYISLQSEPSSHRADNVDIFILPKECCQLSGCLRSFISNISASSSTLNVEEIDNKMLELVVRCITNMYYRKEVQCINELDKKELHELCDAAKKMDCKSLVRLLQSKCHTHSALIQGILQSHFQ